MTPRHRRYLATIIWLGASSVCAAVLTLAGVYLYLNPQIPSAETYRHYNPETPLRVYSRDGALIAEFGERRLIPIGIDEVPKHFINGLLNTEDKRFYQHRGIDYISLANDAVKLLVNPNVRTGASTITMQLARNISFSLEQTFIRKFKEMLLALKIEQELSKDEILELYVNIVPFGKRAYGVQAAAYTYYGKPVSELTLAQLAMLAGIPKKPTGGNPVNGPEWALARRDLVLSRMLDQQSIDQAEFDVARNEPITARVHVREVDVAAPFPAEWVRSELVSRFGRAVYSSGYEVFTTLDSSLQDSAQRALRKGLVSYDKRHGYRGPEGRLEFLAGAEISDPPPADDSDTDPAAPSTTDRVSEVVQILAEIRQTGGLEPAVVIETHEQTFQAVRQNGEVAIIQWEGMKWARPFLSVDSRGPAPRVSSDIVAVGDIVRIHREDDAWQLAQHPEIQGALVSLDTRSGAVRALVGGFDFATNQYNHALQAARQPGSSFKPFVYAAALANGVTPASVFLDAPLVFDDKNLETTYRPRNDSGRYNGPTRLREALYRSINLVSMRVLLEVGAGPILDYVSRFGFDTTSFPRNTQLAIGGGTMAVTPITMARAFAVFANDGYLVEPHIVEHVQDLGGNIIYQSNYPVVCPKCPTALDPEPADDALGIADLDAVDQIDVGDTASPTELDGESAPRKIIPAPRVVDERNVFIVNSMLQDVIRRGTGVRAKALERSDLAGKTGTTNEAADTWFNGYNPDLVTSVWIGFQDHRPIGAREYGSNTPLPVWIDFMRDALAGKPEQRRAQPSGIVTVKIDPRTGLPVRPDHKGAIFEYFLAENAPSIRTGRQTVEPRDRVLPEDIF